MSTFNACEELLGHRVECRENYVPGAGDAIYIAEKESILFPLSKNDNGSIYDVSFVSTASFYRYDCRINQNNLGGIGNGADGATSQNVTETVTFSIEGFYQDVRNVIENLRAKVPRGVCVILSINDVTPAGENRLFFVGETGRGLNNFNVAKYDVTDPVGANIELSGIGKFFANEITPIGGETNAQFLARMLAP